MGVNSELCQGAYPRGSGQMENWEGDLCNCAGTTGFIAEEFCSSLYEVSGGGNVETFADQGFELKNMLAVIWVLYVEAIEVGGRVQ